MNNEANKERVESIFMDAVELQGTDRIRLLEVACKGDAEIRVEVERLLHANDSADSLLDRPLHTADPTWDYATNKLDGQLVGQFKLLQKIGEGGFGVVYMAEQAKPVRRKVALKIIKLGMDSKEVVARFEAERQALAMMDHPNIAKVLDAGTTESGRPFFAMELVNGVSITDYCDKNNLPTNERLSLFQQVCRAVQHAHQKGIIHRDIKPSNVMVTLHDGEPVPKVIDFGVAKALDQRLTEKTLFTRYGQIVGTPQYMSPEQAEMSGLDVDTRSDVYSLGVLLYELLTGQTPLDAEALRSAGCDAMREMIRENEPQKPSTKYRTLDNDSATCIASQRSTFPASLSKTIEGDLDWIVMKTLEKDRNRRYDSANSLLSDIERFLSDDPVEAGPPTFRYQLSKLYRRNKTAVTTLAGIALALLLATGLTTWAWLEAERQKDTAKQEAMKSQATLEILKSLLAQASPDPKLGTQVKVSEFLETFARRLEDKPLDDPKVEIEVRTTLAKSLASFSEYQKAGMQMDAVETLGRTIHPVGSVELAAFLYTTVRRRGRHRAEALLLESLEILKDHKKQTLLKVRILTRLGTLTEKRPELSEARFREAIELANSLEDSERSQLEKLPERGLASILNDQDRFEEAVTAAAEAIELAKKLKHGSEHGFSLLAMSQIQANLRERDKALLYAQQATRVATKINDVECLMYIWKHRTETESLNLEFDAKARREVGVQSKEFIVGNWENLHKIETGHSIGNVLGYARGLLMTSGDLDHALQIETLGQLCAPAQRSAMNSATAQVLRIHGEIEESIEYYGRYNLAIKSGGDFWGFIKCGRSYEAIRDFDSEYQELLKGKEVQSESADSWSRISLDFSIASTLERMGRKEEARQAFALLAAEMPRHSNRLWGKLTAAAYLYMVEMAREPGQEIDESPDSPFGVAIKQLEGDMPDWPLGRVYAYAVQGMIAERKDELRTATDLFVKANLERAGTFAQLHTEWVTDHMVELLVQAKRLDDCENILRADIERRDSQVSPIHPERAFVRLRLVQFLVDQDRDRTGATEFLTDAEKIYDYHANVLPQAERAKFQSLKNAVMEKRH